jgi:hypothetical protein
VGRVPPEEEGAEPRAAKVLFVSPKKTRYLFSDRQGQNISNSAAPKSCAACAAAKQSGSTRNRPNPCSIAS